MILKLTQPKFWHNKNLLSYLLLPLSYVYYLGFLLDKLFTRKHKYKIKTIGIGNITVGGGGKTPFAIWLAEHIYAKQKYCFICKGYLGVIKEPTLVNWKHVVQEVGDEAILLSKIGPTIVSDKKYKGVELAEALGYEVAIVDDALQHHSLECDYMYLVVDGEYGFGNGLMIPAGPLRQPIDEAIAKSNEVVVIGKSDYMEAALRLNPVLNCNIDKKYSLLAFSGIASPNKFFNLLIANGYNVAITKEFPDHHYYTDHELKELINQAENDGLTLVTTEKDMVKIKPEYLSSIKVAKMKYV